MNRILIACLLSAVAFGANIPVQVVGSTETSIKIRYTATSSSGCTVTLQDNSGGPSVVDVNGTLFTGADTDLNRTFANGFRWPTLVNGLVREVHIGGHDETKVATDGKRYSTALQVAASFSGSVTCGADSGTFTAQTANLPLGSYYPELMIPDASYMGIGSWPTPTIDYSTAARNNPYIDPITGVLLKRLDGPADHPYGGDYRAPFNGMSIITGANSTIAAQLMNPGGGWTNPSQAYSSSFPPSLFASTSTTNAVLFMPWTGAAPYYYTEAVDIALYLHGQGTNGTEIIEACISIDGGQTCASGPIDITFGNTAGCKTYSTSSSNCDGVPNTRQGSPETFPTVYFHGWGGGIKPSLPFGTRDIVNAASISNVSVSGSTLTQSGTTPGFTPARAAGTPVYLSGCTTGGPNVVLHIATVDTYNQITVQESGQNLAGCTFQEAAAGIRLFLKNSGTVQLSGYAALAANVISANGSDAVPRHSPNAKVTDITTACDGSDHTAAPLSGQLSIIAGGVYLIQDNGQICLQGNLWGTGSTGHGSLSFVDNPWLSNKKILAVANDGTVFTVTHVANNYQEVAAGGVNGASAPDRFTYTVSTLTPSIIKAKILADTTGNPDIRTALNAGMISDPTLNSGAEMDNGNYYMLWRMDSLGGNGDNLCAVAWTDPNNNDAFVGSAATWNNKNGQTAAACHSVPFALAGFTEIGVGGNGAGDPGPFKFNNTTTFGGPFVSHGVGLHKPDGTFQTWTLPSITTISNASPAIITFSSPLDTSPLGLNYAVGSNKIAFQATCSGGTSGSGFDWTGLNKTLYLRNYPATTSSNTTWTQAEIFLDAAASMPFNATTIGSYSGQTITCVTFPPVWGPVQVSSVSNNGSGKMRITVSTSDSNFLFTYPSGKIPVQNGDSFVMYGYTGWNTLYYAKTGCSGCAANQFDVYTDSALTLPLAYSNINPGFLYYAEQCPDPATIDMSWSFGDSGIGTAGHPIYRCFTARLDSEPCSEFAYINGAVKEWTSYPCPGEPSNQNRSSLHPIHVGDGFQDISKRGQQNYEYMAVLKKVPATGSQLDVTMEREYGDIYFAAGVNWSSGNGSHAAGMAFWQTALNAQVFFDMRQANPAPISSLVSLGHIDMSVSATVGNASVHSSYQGGSADSIYNQPFLTTIQKLSSFTHNDFPTWAGNVSAPYSGLAQNYTSGRQYPGLAPPEEFAWHVDWAAMNPGGGNYRNAVEGVINRGSLTKIRGTIYDLSSATTTVFLIPSSGTPAPKLFPMMVDNGTYGYLVDISGPGSLITDANLGSYCVVYIAGECRPNSTVGQVFAVMRGFWDDGWCHSSNSSAATPCAIVVPPHGGWAIQQQENPLTRNGRGIRRLTLGWHAPMEHGDYQNIWTTPDGKWGIFEVLGINGHARVGAQEGNRWWAAKLPPWPNTDTVVRSQFVNVPVKLTGRPGDSIRISFGYGENGDPASFYCTTRKEACWTSSGATLSNPFLYATETQSPTACGASCTVNIPAIPGRMLFYQVERTNGSSVTLSQIRSIPVP